MNSRIRVSADPPDRHLPVSAACVSSLKILCFLCLFVANPHSVPLCIFVANFLLSLAQFPSSQPECPTDRSDQSDQKNFNIPLLCIFVANLFLQSVSIRVHPWFPPPLPSAFTCGFILSFSWRLGGLSRSSSISVNQVIRGSPLHLRHAV